MFNSTMHIIHQLLDKIGFPVLTIWFVMLYMLETKFVLRKRVQARFQRIIMNGSLSVISYTFLRLTLLPAMVWLAIKNQHWKIGINYFYAAPAYLKFIAGFLLLDYTNYLWHILNHKVNFLWRFHNVHHTDLDLDVTTAIRFHFGEMIGSIIFRGAGILIIGASPALVLIYEIVFEGATAFQHSNWKLPLAVERTVNKIFVTPRMHGIHHSIIRNETDSNFSVIFSFWDRLHRTMENNIYQKDIIVGVPAFRKQEELTFWKLIKMPFTKQRQWQLPDGSKPVRIDEQNKEQSVN